MFDPDDDDLWDEFDEPRLSEAEEDEAFKLWWAHLPDFIKPTYPFDLPPERLPFARHVFTRLGAPRDCRVRKCRRMHACQGGDGPPCFRAQREHLHPALFWFWQMVFEGLPEAEFQQILRESGNRYAQPAVPGKG